MAYVIVMRETREAFGPFEDMAQAEHFAEFITEEVDPCDIKVLGPPHIELLRWRNRVTRPSDDPWAGEPPLTAEQCSPSRPSEGVRIMRGGKVLTRIWPHNAFRLARDLVAAAIETEEEPPF
jgi:hypothetical protein